MTTFGGIELSWIVQVDEYCWTIPNDLVEFMKTLTVTQFRRKSSVELGSKYVARNLAKYQIDTNAATPGEESKLGTISPIFDIKIKLEDFVKLNIRYFIECDYINVDITFQSNIYTDSTHLRKAFEDYRKAQYLYKTLGNLIESVDELEELLTTIATSRNIFSRLL